MAKSSKIDYVSVINWNIQRLSTDEVRSVQNALKLTADGDFGPKTLEAVIAFQLRSNLTPDGKVGRQTLGMINATFKTVIPPQQTVKAFDGFELHKIIQKTIEHESAGRSNPYAAQNRDLEYEGLFDRPSRAADRSVIPPADRELRHWASKFKADGGAHVGLSWGCIQFTQDGGALGDVLQVAFELDRDLFIKVMGGGSEKEAAQLLRVVTASGKRPANMPGGARSPRVQLVMGADLWRKPWTDRFNEAANHGVFKVAQISVAATNYLGPAIQILQRYGQELVSQEDLAIAFDLCVHHGPGRLGTSPLAPQTRRFNASLATSKATAASGFWQKTALTLKRGVIASEVIRLMPPSSRARRETIMRFTDERTCYTPESLYGLTRQEIQRLALSNLST